MLNVAILMGRLVANPTIKEVSSGITVCTFRIAVERSYQKDGEKQTDFIDVVAWRKTAEFVNKYFAKGGMIIVEGSIQTRNYEDKDGNKRTAVEVVASQVQFGESKAAKEQSAPTTQAAPQQPAYPAPQPGYPAPQQAAYAPYPAPGYPGQPQQGQYPAYPQQQSFYPAPPQTAYQQPPQYPQAPQGGYPAYSSGEFNDMGDSDDLPF